MSQPHKLRILSTLMPVSLHSSSWLDALHAAALCSSQASNTHAMGTVCVFKVVGPACELPGDVHMALWLVPEICLKCGVGAKSSLPPQT